MKVDFKLMTHCRACQDESLLDVIDLGESSIADDFFKTRDNTARYPLKASLCGSCGLLQLRHVVDPSAIYDDYIYATSSSPGLRSHFSDYAKDVYQILNLSADSIVMDLGCNDGVLLTEFEKLGCEIVGVEPSEHTTKALRNKGTKIFCGYWDDKISADVVNEVGKVDVITANNVFANVDDIVAFTQHVAATLSPDGTFIVETGSHLSLIDNFVFDNIYHEHLSYFSVTAFAHFFKQFGMEIFHVDKISTKGGSIRVYAGFAGRHDILPNVSAFIAEESAKGLFKQATYSQYMQRIALLKFDVQQTLASLKATGTKIIGFGASATTTTVLHVLDIAEYLSYLIDDNEVKQDTYSPGYRLPVKASKALAQDQGSCVVILPWRFGKMFMQNNQQHIDSGGTFLQIMPEVKLIKSLDESYAK